VPPLAPRGGRSSVFQARDQRELQTERPFAIQKLICNVLTFHLNPCPLGSPKHHCCTLGFETSQGVGVGVGVGGPTYWPLRSTIRARYHLGSGGIHNKNSLFDAPQSPSGLGALAAICHSNVVSRLSDAKESSSPSYVSRFLHLTFEPIYVRRALSLDGPGLADIQVNALGVLTTPSELKVVDAKELFTDSRRSRRRRSLCTIA
jgi:hypothetical protein